MDALFQSRSSFFTSLPAEIRNRIYDELLLTSHSSALAFAQRICPSILRSCKQAYHEATPILYGSNVFLAHPSLLAALPYLLLATHPHLSKMPRPITQPKVAAMIRKFYILLRLDTDPRFTAVQVADAFSGLERLEVDVFQAMYNSCDFTTLRLFERVRDVGTAVVRGSVGDGKYAAWLEKSMMAPRGEEVVTYEEEFLGGNKAWDTWVRAHR